MRQKSVVQLIAAGLIAATACFSQPAQPFDASKFRPGLIVVTTMITTIDTRTSAVGDAVEAKVVKPVKDGKRVVVPQGAHLFGRVVRLEPRSARTKPVVLGILFDHVEFNGTSIPISLASMGPLDAALDGATSRCDGCGLSDLAAQMDSLREWRRTFTEMAVANSQRPADSPAAQASRHVATLVRYGVDHLHLDSHTKCDWVTGWDWVTPDN